MEQSVFDPIGWANTNASAVQALASLAAVVVAVIALIIAALAWQAERSQATSAREALGEARRQADAADQSERSRRWDERVQAVSPIKVRMPEGPYDTMDRDKELEVPIEAPGVPVLDLRIIIRRGPEGSHDAAMGNFGTLAPTEDAAPRVDISEILALAMSPSADATHYRLILNWTGQLGQWVVQEYEYDFVGQMLEFEYPVLRLVRWHVDPRVDGMGGLNVTFE